jgi:hypothetical protein
MTRCWKRWFPPLVAVALALLIPRPARGQTYCPNAPTLDPSRLFRGGLWQEWLYTMTPGRRAQAAIAAKLAQVNAVRENAKLRPLRYFAGNSTTPADPIVATFLEDLDPREVSGAYCAAGPNPPPDREVALGTLVDDGLNSFVLFFDDPIRSDGCLAQFGVPGHPGTFRWSLRRKVNGGAEQTSVAWIATSSAGDTLELAALYTNGDFNSGVRFPSLDRPDFQHAGMGLYTPLYQLTNNPAPLNLLGGVIYAPRPTQTYCFYARTDIGRIGLTASNAVVTVKFTLHDPLLQAMFNDPGNARVTLTELLQGAVRFESQ